MRRVTIYLDDEEFQELRRRAAKRGMTISALVRLSVSRFIEREGVERVVEELEMLRREVEEVKRRLDAASVREFAKTWEPAKTAVRGGETRAGPDSGLPNFLRDNPWLQILSEPR